MRLKLSVLTVFLVFLVLGASLAFAVESGQDAPDFNLKDINGKAFRLSDFKGKVLIVDFFGTWCPPCRGEIPGFVELQNFYGPQGVLVIGVSSEDAGALKKFADSMGINYPVLTDTDEAAHIIYGPIRGIPTTFVIDKNFKVRRHYIGARPKSVFEADIKEMIQ